MFYQLLNQLFILEQNKSKELKEFLSTANIKNVIQDIISDEQLLEKIYLRSFIDDEKTRIHLLSLNEDLYSYLPNKNLFLTIYNRTQRHCTSIHSHTCHKLHYYSHGQAEIQGYKYIDFDEDHLEVLQNFLKNEENHKTKTMFQAIEASKFLTLGSSQFHLEFKPSDLTNILCDFSFNDIFNISSFKSFYAKEDQHYQFIDHVKLLADYLIDINQKDFFFDKGDIYKYYIKTDFLVDLSFEMYPKDRIFAPNHLIDYNQETLLITKKITKKEFKELLINYLFYFD